MRLLQLIGVLLDYPQDDLWQHAGELRQAAADPALLADLPARLSHASRAEIGVQLRAFVETLLASDPLEAQARWVASFDQGRAMSLLLFEHIHGESRERGQAMADLLETYRASGYRLTARELPDYLPLLLEYLAQQPEDQARDWLRHLSAILALLAARAAERELPYAPLLALLTDLADLDQPTPDPARHATLRRRAHDEPRDDTPEAIDRVWEEEAVRFGASMGAGTGAGASSAPSSPDAGCAAISPAPARRYPSTIAIHPEEAAR